jgi:shikimate dehydrogenase
LPDLQLGLIGDNIARSQAPRLHRLAGELCGLDVAYDRLIPREMGLDFDAVFERCRTLGFRGINVTYPYKERAAAKVVIEDPLVGRIAAVNTVLFTSDGPKGFNTDHSGFVAAYRRVLGAERPGAVCMIGAGGVGKAIAFSLLALGLDRFCIVERDLAKAEALATALRAASPGVQIAVTDDVHMGVADVQGVLNCTPVGMVGHAGTPLPRPLMARATWAFDAVYTPVDTQFLNDAAAEGLTAISGYELFFFQGVDAWRVFSGEQVDQAALRQALAQSR